MFNYQNEKLSASQLALANQLFAISAPYFTSVDPAHDLTHTVRVLNQAVEIATEEKANMEIVIAAVCLHDIGRANERVTKEAHEVFGFKKSKIILKKLGVFTTQEIEQIAQCILEHRSKSREFSSLESAILYDADKLDSTGIIGLIRTHAYAGTILQPFYNLDDSENYTVHEEIEKKLVKVPSKMNTETGKRIATLRVERMMATFALLQQEISGEI